MSLAKKFTKRSTFNISKDKQRKKRIKIVIKIKFIYYAIKTKEVLIAIIFSFISILKNIVI